MFKGKTLVSKEKAIQMDNDAADNKSVFYISLLGTEIRGKPNPFRYVFDIITRIFDFRQTNVQAKDVRDLCDYYEDTSNKQSSNTDVYSLCLHFLSEHPHSHFILDEVPFIANTSEYIPRGLYYTSIYHSINFDDA